jgi:hypothetical protein
MVFFHGLRIIPMLSGMNAVKSRYLFYGKIAPLGGMAERLKATVLKTVVAKATVGSNPTPSAHHSKCTRGGAREADWARLLSEYWGQNLSRGFESRPPRQRKRVLVRRVFCFHRGICKEKKKCTQDAGSRRVWFNFSEDVANLLPILSYCIIGRLAQRTITSIETRK